MSRSLRCKLRRARSICRRLLSHLASFPHPVRSSIPVLMLTGTLDATNPIENARDVARGLPNAVVLEIENAAHEALRPRVRFRSAGADRGRLPLTYLGPI